MVTYSVCTRHLLAYFHRLGLAGTLYHCMSLEQETSRIRKEPDCNFDCNLFSKALCVNVLGQPERCISSSYLLTNIRAVLTALDMYLNGKQ